jgi:tetratricopeptide (TPR) repeat protein
MDSFAVDQHSEQSADTPPSTGRGAGLLIVVGLVLLLGGAVTYVITTTSNTTVKSADGATRSGAHIPPANKPLTPDAFDRILNTAQQLLNNGKNAEAEALFKQVLGSHPEAQSVHVEYARFLGGQKRPVESYNEYKAAIALGPVEPDVQLEAGTAANMAGMPDRAIEHYSAAQTAAPTDYRAPLYLGQVQLKLKDTEEAKKNLLLVTKLNPTAAGPAWATLAQVYLDEGKPDFALKFIAEARKLDPKSTVYRVINARAFKRSGNANAALDLLIGLSEAERREPGVMQTMAECFGMLQRPADAAKLYTDASDAEPTNGDWAFQAAVWLEKAGEPKRGVEYAKRAATLNVQGAAALAERLSK